MAKKSLPRKQDPGHQSDADWWQNEANITELNKAMQEVLAFLRLRAVRAHRAAAETAIAPASLPSGASLADIVEYALNHDLGLLD